MRIQKKCEFCHTCFFGLLMYPMCKTVFCRPSYKNITQKMDSPDWVHRRLSLVMRVSDYVSELLTKNKLAVTQNT